jgi:hypothetical protein
MTTSSKPDNFAGMGAPSASRAHAQKAASEAWTKFCTLSRFRVGGNARIGGQRVTIEDIAPLTGGSVYIKASYPGGLIEGKYRPDDLDVV